MVDNRQEYLGKYVINDADISVIDNMDGHDFEYFCAELLQKVGFFDVTVTPGSGDQGVDILAVKDGIKYAVQCKKYSSVLSNTAVQEVAAGKQFYGCHVGVVLTNSTFSSGAEQLADATNVLLWDRQKLLELINNAGGLKNLGFIQIADNVSSEEINNNTDEISSGLEENAAARIQRPRKSCFIWSKICLGWSIVCFLLFIGGLIADENSLVQMSSAEGLFTLVVGLMLQVLSKTEKKNPNIYIKGKGIKKSTFVAICISVAFILFYIAYFVSYNIL